MRVGVFASEGGNVTPDGSLVCWDDRQCTCSDDNGDISPTSQHSLGERKHQPQDYHAEDQHYNNLPGRRRSQHSSHQERIRHNQQQFHTQRLPGKVRSFQLCYISELRWKLYPEYSNLALTPLQAAAPGLAADRDDVRHPGDAAGGGVCHQQTAGRPGCDHLHQAEGAAD